MPLTEVDPAGSDLPHDIRSNQQVLEAHGWDFQRFEALSRKAAADGLRAEHVTLPEQDRFDACAAFVLERGLSFARRYDTARANGLSFSTACYRLMRRRVIDWLRTRVDYRYGGQGVSEHVTADGQMPDAAVIDAATFDQAVDALADRLSPEGLWTLERIARRIAETGCSLWVAATAAGVNPFEAQAMLDRLEHELLGTRAAA